MFYFYENGGDLKNESGYLLSSFIYNYSSTRKHSALDAKPIFLDVPFYINRIWMCSWFMFIRVIKTPIKLYVILMSTN